MIHMLKRNLSYWMIITASSRNIFILGCWTLLKTNALMLYKKKTDNFSATLHRFLQAPGDEYETLNNIKLNSILYRRNVLRH